MDRLRLVARADAYVRTWPQVPGGPVSTQTFAELRQCLGFGIVRLKLLLAIRREQCLDTPGWSGRFVAEVGPQGQVKAAIEPAKREVTLDE